MKNIKNVKISYLLSILLYFFCCYLCAKFALSGLGEVVGSKQILSAFFLLTLLCASKKTYLLMVLPISILIAIYAPVGIEFGPPNFQGVISLYSTDLEEALSFLSLIKTYTYVKALLIVIMPLVAYKIAIHFNIKPWRNKFFVIIVVFVLVSTIKPTKFISNLKHAAQETKESIEKVEKFVSKNSWRDVTTSSTNTDYILVIGESARRDYFHIYGYPVYNTPFLDDVPCVLVSGLSSAGHYTVQSLSLMLTNGILNKQEPRYDFNLIDLAKSAGIETIWISNQGFVGQHDTPVTSIAVRSDKAIFPNSKGYEMTRISDFKLLDFLKIELKEGKEKSRLYVLHTIGSHPDACDKIKDFPESFIVTDPSLDYVACYVSTIKKTDAFLGRLHQIMLEHKNSSGREFSIIYFSDHGQVHDRSRSKIVLNNNGISKFHYDVPLIKIDSESSSRQYLETKKTGLMFTAGLANWMEIRTSQLPVYDLFDGISDVDDFGFSEQIRNSNYEEDPAIDISQKLLH